MTGRVGTRMLVPLLLIAVVIFPRELEQLHAEIQVELPEEQGCLEVRLTSGRVIQSSQCFSG